MGTGVFPGLQSRVCPGRPGQVGSTPTHLRKFLKLPKLISKNLYLKWEKNFRFRGKTRVIDLIFGSAE